MGPPLRALADTASGTLVGGQIVQGDFRSATGGQGGFGNHMGRSSQRPWTITATPSAINGSAMASPMPDVDPVTKDRFPFNPKIILSFSN
jgi:hypothetical protein